MRISIFLLDKQYSKDASAFANAEAKTPENQVGSNIK
jgi:hypothetical protein